MSSKKAFRQMPEGLIFSEALLQRFWKSLLILAESIIMIQANMIKQIVDFGQAIAINPKLYKIYYWRGTAFYQQGHYHQAITNFDQALALTPQDAYIYFCKAQAQEQSGLKIEAVNSYRQFIAKASPDAQLIDQAKQRVEALKD